MQFSVETLEGLERRITVSVPAETVKEEMDLQFRDLAKNAKMDGFRAGKIPMHVLRARFLEGVKMEAARKVIESTLPEALEQSKINPAATPSIDSIKHEENEPFEYSALVEVLPEISIKELNKDEVEQISAEVTDADVDNLIEKMRKEHMEWEKSADAAANGDKVIIDFEGFFGDEPFEGGKAEDFTLVLGSGSMIPGFDEQIVGATCDKPLEIKVTFPENYHHAGYAGKEATFKITVKEILKGSLPPLDEEFAKKYKITEGGMDALRADIRKNMARELVRKVKQLNSHASFETLLGVNDFDIPKSLVEQEIANLKHQMYHRIFGDEHSEDEQIPDFPRNLFEDSAKKRVQLSILLSEYRKLHNIIADKARVEATIDNLATAYELPEEVRRWYMNNKEQSAQIESMVIEEMIAEKILENATLKKKTLNYEEVMNLGQAQ